MDAGNICDVFDGFRDLGSDPRILGMLAIGIFIVYLGIAHVRIPPELAAIRSSFLPTV
jgi:hypothetical protein